MNEHHLPPKKHYEWTTEELRLVRQGWYRKFDTSISEKGLDDLSDAQRVYYMHYQQPFKKRFVNGLKTLATGIGGLLFIAVIYSSIWWIPSTWNWFNGDGFVMSVDKTSSSSSSPDSPRYSAPSSSSNSYDSPEEDCNENYSPCIENSYYDLDCADVGQEVEVIGDDEYGLDRDNDGWGCESY